MDTAALDAARADLLAWGLLEDGAQGLAWTRRFRGAVMRAASAFAELERAGKKPDGHPLATAVRQAVEEWELPAGAQATRAHEQLLVAVELAALPDPVRELLGG